MRTIFALVALLLTSTSVRGDDWMYRPSAYSHSPKWGYEVGSNRFSRGPYYGPQYGAFFRSGYRNMYGNGWYGRGWYGDYSNITESWFQSGEMFSY